MNTMLDNLGPGSTMRQVLERYPGAQRALFRRYHIGGCSSCGFQPDETLEDVCRRNNGLEVREVLEQIRASHDQDARVLMEPKELAETLSDGRAVKLLDIRSQDEFHAARIAGSILLSEGTLKEMMAQWPRDQLLILMDHQGRQALDAAAYFMGHGFQNVRALRGGIDAWSQDIDGTIPRYRLA